MKQPYFTCPRLHRLVIIAVPLMFSRSAAAFPLISMAPRGSESSLEGRDHSTNVPAQVWVRLLTFAIPYQQLTMLSGSYPRDYFISGSGSYLDMHEEEVVETFNVQLGHSSVGCGADSRDQGTYGRAACRFHQCECRTNNHSTT